MNGDFGLIDRPENSRDFSFDVGGNVFNRHHVNQHGNTYDWLIHKHPDVRQQTISGLVSRFGGYSRVVEVGIGRNPAVAAGLLESCAVKATDIVPCPVPDGVEFVIDDVTDPSPGVYSGCELVYGLNLPPDLHMAVARCAARFGADFAFTTLGFDPPVVAVSPESVPGETVYWAVGAGEPGSVIQG